ncbi:MAG TPA: hypothetical protein VIR31_07935 [Nitrososphaeraceae archaeon]
MVQSSLEGLKGESPEEIVDNVINVHKNNISKNWKLIQVRLEGSA